MNFVVPGMQQSDASLYLPVLSPIVDVRELTAREKLFSISVEGLRGFVPRPCQFVMLSLFGVGEAPLSISAWHPRSRTIELCVRAVGTVTRALHRRKRGERVGLRGPYGNGFDLNRIGGRDLLFVAGGLGLAPLRSLIHAVLEERKSFGKLTLLYGARSPAELLFRDEIESWTAQPNFQRWVTVDVAESGWEGHVGVITRLFRNLRLDPLQTVAVVVGPPVMYQFVLREILARGLPEGRIFLSFERRMRCAVGKCGHCQINGLWVCQDGPVLSLSQVKTLPEAL